MQTRNHSGQTSTSSLMAQVERLLSAIETWRVFIVVLIVMSLLEVTSAEGKWTVNFHVTVMTVILIALAGVPELLRLLMLRGGNFKVMDFEISFLPEWLNNLESPTHRAVLPPFIAALEGAESGIPPTEQPKVRAIRQELENQLASLLLDTTETQKRIKEYAQRYEKLRRDMPFSPERTTFMSMIAAESRALAKHAYNMSPNAINTLFQNGGEGERMVALAFLQATPDPACINTVFSAISASKSAFEQSMALRVAEDMLPQMTYAQAQELACIVCRQRQPGQHIATGKDNRWPISRRILEAIQKKGHPLPAECHEDEVVNPGRALTEA